MKLMETIYSRDDKIEIRPFPKVEFNSIKWFSLSDTDPDNDLTGTAVQDLWDHILKLNKTTNIGFGINPRKHVGAKKNEGVALARCLACDLDYHDGKTITTPDFYEAHARQKLVDAKLPEPSIIINSSHGFWLLWMLDEPLTDLGLWQRHQESLAAALGGDTTGTNPERIIRMPGTVNHKSPMALATLMTCSSVKHSLSAFPAPAPEVKKAEPKKFVPIIHPHVTSKNMSIDQASKNMDVFFAMWFKKYPAGVEGVQLACADAGLSLTGSLTKDGDGVGVVSPYESQYKSPLNGLGTDFVIYSNFGFGALHQHDKDMYSTHPNPTWGFAERFLPNFMSEYYMELEKNNKPKSTAWESKTLSHSPVADSFFKSQVTELFPNDPQAAVLALEKSDIKDITIPLQSFPQPTKRPPRETLTYSLNEFPVLIQNLTNSFSKANPILSPIFHVGWSYNIIGSLLGKRLWNENYGCMLYPNLWSVYLMSSGGNKSGTFQLTETSYQNHSFKSLLSKATMPMMIKMLGKTIGGRDKAKMTPGDIIAEKQKFLTQCRDYIDGKIILTDECTGTISQLLGAWDSKNQTKDLEDFLKLCESGRSLDSSTIGDGERFAYDMCVSFAGFTQAKTWNAKFGNDSFRSCGFFGRFIPYTDKSIKLTDLNCDGIAPFGDLFSDLCQKINKINHRTECYFGEPSTDLDKNPDEIGIMAKEVLQGMKEFRHIFSEELKDLKSKLIMVAMRMSMIDAFCDKFTEDSAPLAKLDCRKYFKRNFAMVSALYFEYYMQIELVSDFSVREKKILQELKKHPDGMSRTDIQRKFNFASVKAVEEQMEPLISDQKVISGTRENEHGPKSVLYKYVGPTE